MGFNYLILNFKGVFGIGGSAGIFCFKFYFYLFNISTKSNYYYTGLIGHKGPNGLIGQIGPDGPRGVRGVPGDPGDYS